MKNYGKTRSTAKPEPLSIDELSVWVNKDITEINDGGFDGWEYEMIKYSKEEYIIETLAFLKNEIAEIRSSFDNRGE